MNRKRLTILSVAAAIALAASLVVGVWFSYFTGRGEGFVLPSPMQPGFSPEDPIPSSGGVGFTPVNVDAGNVVALLTAITRPYAYSQTVLRTVYWEGGQSVTTHHVAVRGDATRIETEEDGGVILNRIVTPERIYLWSGSIVPYHELKPEDAGAEDLSGLPTWEDAASLPPDDILEAASFYEENERRLSVKTRQPVYIAEYVISLDTGLLVSATYTDPDGGAAFAFVAGAPELGDPGDARFTLPDDLVVG
ncbi:MAG: hypothetical protein LBR72_05220 [Oscillospiraceae bacterium]|jgi:hypothetical protein|nr:hypothetical protein [Oscillospiraceae bacterium]